MGHSKENGFFETSLLALVAELGYWPQGANSLTQAIDGELLFWRENKLTLPRCAISDPDVFIKLEPNSLVSICYADYVHSTLASDQQTAIVSYEEYIAALPSVSAS